MNLILEALDNKSKYLLQYAVDLTLDDKQHLRNALNELLFNRWLELFTMSFTNKEDIKSLSHNFSNIYEQIHQSDNSNSQLMCEIYMLLMILMDLRKTIVFIDLISIYTNNTSEITQLCEALVLIGLDYKSKYNSSQYMKFNSVIEYSKEKRWSVDSKSFILNIINNIKYTSFKYNIESKWNELYPNDTISITSKDIAMNNKVVIPDKEMEVLTDVWHGDESYCVTNSTKIKNICELAHRQGIEFKISPVSYISTSNFACGMIFWSIVFAVGLFSLLSFCIKSSGDYWFIPVIYIAAFALWNKGDKLFKFWYRWCITGIIATMKSFIFISKKPFITATALIAGILTYMNLEKLNNTVTEIVDTIMKAN